MSAPFDLYQTVTDQIVAMLDAGVVPWRSPILGGGVAGHPKNLTSGRPYRGINVFLLAAVAHERGYASPNWFTFNQARDLGGTVRKGERSTLVVYFKPYETTDRETGESVTVPLLRFYRLFSVDQSNGITDPDAVPVPNVAPFLPVTRSSFLPSRRTRALASDSISHIVSWTHWRNALRIRPSLVRPYSSETLLGTCQLKSKPTRRSAFCRAVSV